MMPKKKNTNFEKMFAKLLSDPMLISGLKVQEEARKKDKKTKKRRDQ